MSIIATSYVSNKTTISPLYHRARISFTCCLSSPKKKTYLSLPQYWHNNLTPARFIARNMVGIFHNIPNPHCSSLSGCRTAYPLAKDDRLACWTTVEGTKHKVPLCRRGGAEGVETWGSRSGEADERRGMQITRPVHVARGRGERLVGVPEKGSGIGEIAAFWRMSDIERSWGRVRYQLTKPADENRLSAPYG